MTLPANITLSEQILRQNVSAVLQGWYWGHDAEQTAWYLYYNHFRQTWRTHILENKLAQRWELARRALITKNEEWNAFVPSLSDMEDGRLGVVLAQVELRRFCTLSYPLEPRDAATKMYLAATNRRKDGGDIHEFSGSVELHLNRLIKAE